MTLVAEKPALSGKPGKDRWEWLYGLETWDEIETRLRYRWSPRRVTAWHARAYPGKECPAWRTLYKFVSTRHFTWFIEPLKPAEHDTGDVPRRVMVVEELAGLMQLVKQRIMAMIKFEKGFDGLPIPTVSREIELYSRMLDQYVRLQQELGLIPKVSAAGRRDESDGGAGESGASMTLRPLVDKLRDLEGESFIAGLTEIFGPPGNPRNRPVVIETTAKDLGVVPRASLPEGSDQRAGGGEVGEGNQSKGARP